MTKNSIYFTDYTSQPDQTKLLAKIAEQQLLNITEYLDKSGHEINRRKRLKNAFIIAVSSLCIIAIAAFIWAFTERGIALENKRLIEITSKSNQIATKAYMNLDKDPTLAFRLAEQAYKIHPTPLAKQVIMAAYGEVPFYVKLVGHTESARPAKFSPDGKLIVTGSLDNTVRLWDFNGFPVAIMEGHKSGNPNNNESVNFSPDGKYIVSASYDSTARLWDLTGKCLAVMKHDGAVNSACFSPHAFSRSPTSRGAPNTQHPDTYLILTASSDKTARLWDMEGNELVRFEGHTKGLRLAKFSPNGKIIVTVSSKEIKVWNDKGEFLIKLNGHNHRLYDITFSKTGKYVATGDVSGKVIIWNNTWKKINELKGHHHEIHFSHDEKYLIHISDEPTNIKLYNIIQNNEKILRGHTAFIWSINFSPDGKYILSTSDDGTARLWDLNGTELMVLKGHTSQVLSANFSPDGKYVVTASGDQTARIWNIQPKENPVFKGHTAYVVDANFSPDGEYVVTAGWDYTARLWEAKGNLIKIMKHQKYYCVDHAVFSRNGKFLTTNYSSGELRIYDYQGELLHILKHDKGVDRSYYPNFSYDGSLILSLNFNNSIMIWDSSGHNKQEIPNSISAAFLPYSHEFLINVSTDSSLYFYQKTSKDSLPYEKIKQLKIPGTAYTSVDFSPDNHWFLTTSEDSIVRLWKFENVQTLPEDSIKPLYKYKHPTIVNQPLFSPDSKLFLTVGNDNIVRLFDLKCNVIADMKGHSDAINEINFSPDGKYIVTGSNDNTVRIWDLKGNELQLFPGHKAAVTKVQFSSDGSYILSASNDHTARLMPVSVKDILHKINVEKVRGTVFQLSEDDKHIYGIVD